MRSATHNLNNTEDKQGLNPEQVIGHGRNQSLGQEVQGDGDFKIKQETRHKDSRSWVNGTYTLSCCYTYAIEHQYQHLDIQHAPYWPHGDICVAHMI